MSSQPKSYSLPKEVGLQANLSPSVLPFSDLNDRELTAFCGVNRAILQFLVLRTSESIKDSGNLTRAMKITLLLMKLKLQVSFDVLGATFNVSSTTAKTVFRKALDAVYEVAKEGLVWIERDQIQARMPAAFKALYPDTRVIIDCTEMACEKPGKVRQRVLMYSNYKSNFTLKFLVGVAPSGEFMFASEGYGGRATDTFITCNSGFLNLIEDGDVVLADKGFPVIERNLNQQGGFLVMPPFKCGQRQFTEQQNQDGYKCASVRVHVERAIARLKVFECLNYAPIHMVPNIDKALVIICFLTNLFNDLIKED